MKSRNVLLAMALVTLGSLPLAQLTPAAQSGKVEGAKDLFYKQLDKPQLAMNTGVQYWIELHRKGQVLKVSNKTAFFSGDKIRFHVRPNIDGYAYVLLKSGSRGDRDVLFPVAKYGDDNHIVHGRDISIPEKENDLLEFDNDPGIEHVGIVLSRKPINAQEYLNKTQPVVIASGIEGSKDLVPSRVTVQPAAVQEAQSTDSRITTVATTGVPSTGAVLSDNPTQPVKPIPDQTPRNPGAHSNKEETGVTTVVTEDAGILGVDIMLQHL